jgi:hypothetical protein
MINGTLTQPAMSRKYRSSSSSPTRCSPGGVAITALAPLDSACRAWRSATAVDSAPTLTTVVPAATGQLAGQRRHLVALLVRQAEHLNIPRWPGQAPWVSGT